MSFMPRSFPTAWLLTALCLAVTPAAAQPRDAAARAQALFDEAAAELDAGKLSSACRKLEEVTRLLPEAIGARETLGECYEKQGKLGSAWSQYTTAAQLASKQREAARAKSAERHAAALRARAATLVLDLRGEVAGLSGLAVSLDGRPVPQPQWSAPVPVDAGQHVVTVTAPGRKSVEKRWTATNGAPAKVSIAALEADPGSGSAAQGGGDPAGQDGSAGGSGPDGSSEVPGQGSGAAPRPWQLPAGIAAAGLGLAAAGAGAALGVVAIDKKNASNADGHCDATGCDDTGFALRTEALAFGNGSTAAFIAGGVLLAGGVVVAVLAPRSPKVETGRKSAPATTAAPVTVLFTGTGFSVRGGF